jgi:hypothetical protein
MSMPSTEPSSSWIIRNATEGIELYWFGGLDFHLVGLNRRNAKKCSFWSSHVFRLSQSGRMLPTKFQNSWS